MGEYGAKKTVFTVVLCSAERSGGVVEDGPQEPFILVLCTYFQNLPCKSLCLGLLLTFFSNCTLLLSGGLDLIGYHVTCHGCRILDRIKFCFHQKYLCYLEYFEEGNGLLRRHSVFSD